MASIITRTDYFRFAVLGLFEQAYVNPDLFDATPLVSNGRTIGSPVRVIDY